MRLPINTPKPFVLLLPLGGMGLFVVLYALAAFNYPGGSWMFPEKEGFSFWNNYLCDLLDHTAINGELNAARYWARTSLGVLCASILLLWYYLPLMFSRKSNNQIVMWLTGILSLLTTFSLSSGTHDITVRIARVFGSIAFISSFIALFRDRYFKLVIFGIASLVLFLVNYYIYETGNHVKMLPVIQKVTFVSCILWFVVLDITFYKKLKHQKDVLYK